MKRCVQSGASEGQQHNVVAALSPPVCCDARHDGATYRVAVFSHQRVMEPDRSLPCACVEVRWRREHLKKWLTLLDPCRGGLMLVKTCWCRVDRRPHWMKHLLRRRPSTADLHNHPPRHLLSMHCRRQNYLLGGALPARKSKYRPSDFLSWDPNGDRTPAVLPGRPSSLLKSENRPWSWSPDMLRLPTNCRSWCLDCFRLSPFCRSLFPPLVHRLTTSGCQSTLLLPRRWQIDRRRQCLQRATMLLFSSASSFPMHAVQELCGTMMTGAADASSDLRRCFGDVGHSAIHDESTWNWRSKFGAHACGRQRRWMRQSTCPFRGKGRSVGALLACSLMRYVAASATPSARDVGAIYWQSAGHRRTFWTMIEMRQEWHHVKRLLRRPTEGEWQWRWCCRPSSSGCSSVQGPTGRDRPLAVNRPLHLTANRKQPWSIVLL